MHPFQMLASILLFISCSVVHGAPTVVVSIKPLHSLVAAVMEGVDEPYLLLKGDQSPHHLTLKPSQVKAIRDADLLVWVGPVFERFLSRISLSERIEDLRLISVEGITLLPTRVPGYRRDERVGNHSDIDGHVWLDPTNASVIVSEIADRLQIIDSENGHLYQSNAQRVQLKLAELDAKLIQKLRPFHAVPYLTYHDALQYFERRYGLNGVAITTHPERQTGAKSSLLIRRLIMEKSIKCVFREPQFRPKFLDILIEELPIRDGVVDPIGLNVVSGPDGYFMLMEHLAAAFERCFKQ